MLNQVVTILLKKTDRCCSHTSTDATVESKR